MGKILTESGIVEEPELEVRNIEIKPNSSYNPPEEPRRNRSVPENHNPKNNSSIFNQIFLSLFLVVFIILGIWANMSFGRFANKDFSTNVPVSVAGDNIYNNYTIDNKNEHTIVNNNTILNNINTTVNMPNNISLSVHDGLTITQNITNST